MKRYSFFLLSALLMLFTQCVQKSYPKTVVYTLVLSGQKNVNTVGIRGTWNPLSWRKDYPMKEVIKDSVYTATITTITGFTWSEVKFTVNGEFELKNQDNRRIPLKENDTVNYRAVFNVAAPQD